MNIYNGRKSKKKIRSKYNNSNRCINNMSDSNIIKKEDQSEFFSIREGILNLGRMVSYSILLFAGISGSIRILNITLIILTLSIFIMGFVLKDIEKFEE